MNLLRCVAVLGVFFLSGCSYNFARITEAEMVGVWVSSGGAELRFDAQGRFFGTKLPMDIMGFIDYRGTVKLGSGSGSWRVVYYQGSKEHGDAKLRLDFDHGQDFPDGLVNIEIFVVGNGPSRWIYYGLEDGPKIKFKKRGEPLPNGKEEQKL
jgi:hypothetical protein